MRERGDAVSHGSQATLAIFRSPSGEWLFALSTGVQLSYGPLSSSPTGLPRLRDAADHLPHRMIGVDLVVAIPVDGVEDLEQAIRCSPWFAGARIHVYPLSPANMMAALGLTGAAGCEDPGSSSSESLRRAVAEHFPGVDEAALDDAALPALAMLVAGRQEFCRRKAQVQVKVISTAHTIEGSTAEPPASTSAGEAPSACASTSSDRLPTPRMSRRRDRDRQNPGGVSPSDTLLSVAQTAEFLGISTSAAYRLRRYIRWSKQPGVGLRFRRSDLEAYTASRPPLESAFLGSRTGTTVARHGDDRDEVLPGMTRAQLKERAGF